MRSVDPVKKILPTKKIIIKINVNLNLVYFKLQLLYNLIYMVVKNLLRHTLVHFTQILLAVYLTFIILAKKYFVFKIQITIFFKSYIDRTRGNYIFVYTTRKMKNVRALYNHLSYHRRLYFLKVFNSNCNNV